MIKLQHISKDFGHLKVLKDINLEVKQGQKVVVVGPSGSGKSTMLRLLNGLETPNDGKILFNGKNILETNFDWYNHRKKVGMIFQQFNLFNHLNVLENCIIGQQKVLKRSKKEATEIALHHLRQVGLEDFAEASVNTISGGQKQRVAIARALCMDPEVLLFDEPTSALDPQMVEEVLHVIEQLAHSGLTMVIVTHEMQFAHDVADEVVFMKDGQVVEQGHPKKIFSNPTQPDTQLFLAKFINRN